MKNILRYGKPASKWEEGMAVGNGRLGAMVLGETKKEHIWLNEDTLWSGYPRDYNNPHVYEVLKKVREDIFAKNYQEAEDTINQKMVGFWNESYMPMADLWMEMPELKEEENTFNNAYERQLDIRQSVCTTTIHRQGITYERTIFCSHPDQVLVVHLKASEKIRGTCRISLNSQLKHWIEETEGTLVLKGWCPTEVEPDYYECENPILYEDYKETRGIKFQVQVKAVSSGKIILKNQAIEISDTDELLLLVTSANSFQGYNQKPEAPFEKQTEQILEKAALQSYDRLLQRHLEDVIPLFERVEIDLGHSENEKLFMDERLLRAYNGEEDPELYATAFQFGRYLLIACSREGTQPANLQGIWNQSVRPPWSSNYTVNINTQMNYWPAEVGNLSECAEPLLKFIKETAESGQKTAEINYHCRGWVAHHNIDLWRKTTAVGSRNYDRDVLPWSFWVMSGGWLCRHLWEHYLFTMDRDYLEKEAYPLMKSCAQFYLDWLVEYQGKLVTNPSTSPENLFLDQGEAHGIGIACTMDNEILRELFSNCLEAIGVLEDESQEEFEELLKEALPRIPEFQIGKYGQLQEWYEDFEEKDPTHRHLSALYGLYPSNQISPEKTPELAEACRVTMKRKGEGSVPWSRAWKIGIAARLKDGEQAYREVKEFLQLTEDSKISYDNGGVYQNLFCARPLEVDGNFGFTGCMAEMFVQSQNDRIEWLPAIPKSWKDGRVKGLKVRGGQSIDLEWKNGKIIKAELR